MATLTLQSPGSMEILPTMQLQTPKSRSQPYSFSFEATDPPLTEASTIMQRGDEVNTVQRMLNDPKTTTVLLTGDHGVGKSTLAALLYRRLQLAAEAGLPAPKHLIWLSLGKYTTIPDILAAILSRISPAYDPSFFALAPEQQLSIVVDALSRIQEKVLIVLDGFEFVFCHDALMQIALAEAVAAGGPQVIVTPTNMAEYGHLPLFLQMLQHDLGTTRFLVVSYRSPYGYVPETRVRSYLMSRITIPEGVALLQQKEIPGSYEELSLVWQRCAGQVIALHLFNALMKLSHFSLSYLIDSSDYHHLWQGEVTKNLVEAVYHHLDSIQYTLMRTLSLFDEPVTAQGILTTIAHEHPEIEKDVYEQELHQLTALSLIQQLVNKHGLSSYILHPLLRQYILDHYLEGNGTAALEGPATEKQIEARHTAIAAGHLHIAAYYQQLLQEICPPLEKRHGPEDVEAILAAIRHFCLGWHWQDGCDLLFNEGIYESMVQWGAWHTLIRLYKGMLPPIGVLTRRDEGLIYSHLGLLYSRLGDYQQSFVLYEQALATQEKIRDLTGAATTLTNRGELLRMLGNTQQARTDFEQALALNEQLKDPIIEGILLHNIAILLHTEKQYQQALSYYQQALKHAYLKKEQTKTGKILTNIGTMFYEQGFIPEAVSTLLLALRFENALPFTTVNFITTFLENLEQAMGSEAYTQLRLSAVAMKEYVLGQLLTA